ncbi:hypothetical protein EIP86_003082 [Pleurotus ostreatoroseus]|nr:hypothetical protein EIP86_003082 [Pleurotus ostreatoroseus]
MSPRRRPKPYSHHPRDRGNEEDSRSEEEPLPSSQTSTAAEEVQVLLSNESSPLPLSSQATQTSRSSSHPRSYQPPVPQPGSSSGQSAGPVTEQRSQRQIILQDTTLRQLTESFGESGTNHGGESEWRWVCRVKGCNAALRSAAEFDIQRHLESHLPPDHHLGRLLCGVDDDGTPCTRRYMQQAALTRHRQRVHGWLTKEEQRMANQKRRWAPEDQATIRAWEKRATKGAESSWPSAHIKNELVPTMPPSQCLVQDCAHARKRKRDPDLPSQQCLSVSDEILPTKRGSRTDKELSRASPSASSSHSRIPSEPSPVGPSRLHQTRQGVQQPSVAPPPANRSAYHYPPMAPPGPPPPLYPPPYNQYPQQSPGFHNEYYYPPLPPQYPMYHPSPRFPPYPNIRPTMMPSMNHPQYYYLPFPPMSASGPLRAPPVPGPSRPWPSRSFVNTSHYSHLRNTPAPSLFADSPQSRFPSLPPMSEFGSSTQGLSRPPSSQSWASSLRHEHYMSTPVLSPPASPEPSESSHSRAHPASYSHDPCLPWSRANDESRAGPSSSRRTPLPPMDGLSVPSEELPHIDDLDLPGTGRSRRTDTNKSREDQDTSPRRKRKDSRKGKGKERAN